MPQIRVGEYLLRRVKELGVHSVFGVPGDYELALLDLVPECGLSWKGTANELIAAYSADGYARVNGIGALITTFGPGELSALNGIAGAYAERLPVIHIVGYPAFQAMHDKLVVHHTLGYPNYTAYHEMSKNISCATTVLMDADSAPAEIDRVLNAMLYHSQPVYIGVPGAIGIATIEDPSNRPALIRELPIPHPEEEKTLLNALSHKFINANRPLAVIDCGVLRAHAIEDVMSFVEKFRIPFLETSMTKGALDEKHSLFAGQYKSGICEQDARLVAGSDCILWFGPFMNDLNTPGVKQDIQGKSVVLFHRTHTEVDGKSYQVNLKAVMKKLTDSSNDNIFKSATPQELSGDTFPAIAPPEGEVIKSEWLCSYLTNLLRPGDLLLTETGTIGINIRRTRFPHTTTHLTQKLWGSIGWATGASLGAFVAAKELGPPKYRRNMLFTGDGSFQMTAQVVGDLIRYGTDAYVFIINNSGYAIERAIHGESAPYNDIAPWNYQLLPQFFSSSSSTSSSSSVTYQVHTPAQLYQLITELNNDDDDKQQQREGTLRVIEIHQETHDYGDILQRLGKVGDRFNLDMDWEMPKGGVESMMKEGKGEGFVGK